jgi:hypothetical protein
MVTVYFLNGQSGTVKDGTGVKYERGFRPGGGDTAATEVTIVIVDANDKELGRFRLAHVIGYAITR